MGTLGRIIGLGISVIVGYASYFCFKYWWTIYNKLYSEITPLQHDLAGWGFWGGIVLAALALFIAILSLSD